MLELTPLEQRQQLIIKDYVGLSLRRQCELLAVNRSTLYYKAADVDADDLDLLNEICDIGAISFFMDIAVSPRN